MDNRTAHLGVYDTLTDSEVGHLLVELHTGRFTGTRFDVVAVTEDKRPITTMGGICLSPEMLLGDLDPRSSDLLMSFAAAATRLPRAHLGLATGRELEVHEALFHQGDHAAFPVLMEGQASY